MPQPSFRFPLNRHGRRVVSCRFMTRTGAAREPLARGLAGDVEDAGQQEVLNWWALLGAMQAQDARLEWSEFLGTHIFNSNKVFAAFESR
ncbi:MAG: hypothetical protein K8R60_10230 [Burkholderiales bacterium]|nr:hypothetical protein [Burkholderiales bacterium]